MTLVGFEPDVGGVGVLFASPLMPASRAMLARGRVRDTRGGTHVPGPSARASWSRSASASTSVW